jgi:hypothetical protein
VSLKNKIKRYWHFSRPSLPYWMTQAWYWLRTHTINRYHMVDGRSPQNGYGWGWIDRDRLLLYASFNILVDFVENEKPFEVTDWEWSEVQKHVKTELEDLYQWWKEGRAKEHAEVDKLLEVPGSPWIEEQEKLNEKDNTQLHRLINVRGFMWT